MTISIDEVRRIANLAKLAISEQEASAFLGQLNGILGLIEEMRSVDTSAIAPMSHAQDFALRLREDVVTEADQHELFQSRAPQVEAGLYLVPKVIE